MRIECTEPGFEQNWVEVSERWTRRETANLWAVAGEELFAIIREKTTACHVVPVVGDPITDPQLLTPENLMDCDETVLSFLGGALTRTIAERRRIGNFSGRPSSVMNGATK